MDIRKTFYVALICVIILTAFCSCVSIKEQNYNVLFAGSSDSSSDLSIPIDIDLSHHKIINRDRNRWPDEMVIQFEEKLYNCTFDEVLSANENNGYKYIFKMRETNTLGYFVLNEKKAIVGYYCNKTRLSEEEKEGQNQIDESGAIAIAEQVFRNYFDVDYSLYDTSVKKDESIPSISSFDVCFKRKYDSHIEIADMLLVTVGLYGEIIHFNGLALESIIPPEQTPDIEEIQRCIEKRIIDLLKEQKIPFSDLRVKIDRMQLVYDKGENKYRVICILSFDCKGNVDGVEKDIHDFIEAIVICN